MLAYKSSVRQSLTDMCGDGQLKEREGELQASPTVARSAALLVCTVEEANLLLREYACRHGHTHTHSQCTVDTSDVQRVDE